MQSRPTKSVVYCAGLVDKNKMPGIGVILNPHSKRYRKSPHKLETMGFIVGEKGDFRATQDLDDVRAVAKRFKDKEIDILALSGGDGTNHRTLTIFIQLYQDQPLPKIALLRGGTLNTIASSCGIRGTPEKILMNLIYKYHSNESFRTIPIYPMCINGRYGFIWGCGVIFRFMDAYYTGETVSPPQAAWTLTHSIASALVNGRLARALFRRFDATVTVNGHRWPYANYSAIYAGSVAQLGLNFRVFYLAGRPDVFHGIGFSLPPRNVLRYVPKMFFGKPSGCPDLLEEACQEMQVKLEEPLSYTIDGDMYEPVDSFRITPGPALEVVVA